MHLGNTGSNSVKAVALTWTLPLPEHARNAIAQSVFSARQHHRSWCERQAPIRQSIQAPVSVKAEKDIPSVALAADVVHVDPEADSSVVVLCQCEDVLTMSAKWKQQQLAEEPYNMFSAPWLLCGILPPKVVFEERTGG